MHRFYFTVDATSPLIGGTAALAKQKPTAGMAVTSSVSPCFVDFDAPYERKRSYFANQHVFVWAFEGAMARWRSIFEEPLLPQNAMSDNTQLLPDPRNHHPVHVFVSNGCFQPYAIIGRTTLHGVRQLAEHYLAPMRTAQRLQCRVRVIDAVTSSVVANGHWYHGRLWLTIFADPVRADSASNHSMLMAARMDDLLSAIAAALLSQGFTQTSALWLEKEFPVDQARNLLGLVGSGDEVKDDAAHTRLAFCQMDGILRFQINTRWCRTTARLTPGHARMSDVLAQLAVSTPLLRETRAVEAALAAQVSLKLSSAEYIPAFLCQV